ncbi:MAG TPA: TlpA disulfide reductase family protein, partial [Candidatus Hydrogenedentes bacterium]|nr:TlpA disulfide reductase family protein [Candidatus Hydrogenedentota bacterium]
MTRTRICGWDRARIARVSAALALAALALGCPQEASGPSVGEAAPALDVAEWVTETPCVLGDGETIVVVEFWATWCPFCVLAIPHLTELQHAFRDAGVRVVGVTDENAETVRAFVEEQGESMAYTVALDNEGRTNDAYEILRIPQAFVVDGEGFVVWRGHPNDRGLEKALKKL